jgi:hypothetical protein
MLVFYCIHMYCTVYTCTASDYKIVHSITQKQLIKEKKKSVSKTKIWFAVCEYSGVGKRFYFSGTTIKRT